MEKEDLQYYINDPSRIEALIKDYEYNEKQWNKLIKDMYSCVSELPSTPKTIEITERLRNYIELNIKIYEQDVK